MDADPSEPETFGGYYQSMWRALSDVSDRASDLIEMQGSAPVAGSIGTVETESADPEALATARTQGALQLNIAADHLHSMTRVLVEPVLVFAPWTLLRAMLESASTAVWLLDPDIPARDRIARSMVLRLRDLDARKRYLRIALADDEESSSSLAEAIEAVRTRIEALAAEALERGLTADYDRHGKDLIGFGGVRVPTATSLADSAFGHGDRFVLLSSLTHGRSWAAQLLALDIAMDGTIAAQLEPLVSVQMALDAFLYLRRSLYDLFTYMGFELTALTKSLADWLNELGASATSELRFWQT